MLCSEKQGATGSHLKDDQFPDKQKQFTRGDQCLADRFICLAENLSVRLQKPHGLFSKNPFPGEDYYHASHDMLLNLAVEPFKALLLISPV